MNITEVTVEVSKRVTRKFREDYYSDGVVLAVKADLEEGDDYKQVKTSLLNELKVEAAEALSLKQPEFIQNKPQEAVKAQKTPKLSKEEVDRGLEAGKKLDPEYEDKLASLFE